MIKKIAEENMHNLKFIRDEQLEMHVANQGHFKNYWGVDINDKLNAKFVKLIEGIPMHWDSKFSETVAIKAKNDVLISTLGFKEV